MRAFALAGLLLLTCQCGLRAEPADPVHPQLNHVCDFVHDQLLVLERAVNEVRARIERELLEAEHNRDIFGPHYQTYVEAFQDQERQLQTQLDDIRSAPCYKSVINR